MRKVIVIVGPTGVGKTRLSISLAHKFNGEIISGDSMQIYRMMDIGTAKVTPEEMDGVIHHLIDVKDPTDSYSVSDYQTEVRKKIEEISDKGKMPIIVGGTGLYIRAVLYDYIFEESDVDHEVYVKKYKSYSNEELYDHLKEIDAPTASTLHPNNRRRILRAIEIYETTGHRKSDVLASQKHEMIYDAYTIGLTCERSLLYMRINDRVDQMCELGFEEEVRHLYDLGLNRNHQSMKAIGYKEWFDYFEGKTSKEDVLEAIKKHSRNYAKRQYTWFNNQMIVHWYDVNFEDFSMTISDVEKDIELWI